MKATIETCWVTAEGWCAPSSSMNLSMFGRQTALTARVSLYSQPIGIVFITVKQQRIRTWLQRWWDSIKGSEGA